MNTMTGWNRLRWKERMMRRLQNALVRAEKHGRPDIAASIRQRMNALGLTPGQVPPVGAIFANLQKQAGAAQGVSGIAEGVQSKAAAEAKAKQLIQMSLAAQEKMDFSAALAYKSQAQETAPWLFGGSSGDSAPEKKSGIGLGTVALVGLGALLLFGGGRKR